MMVIALVVAALALAPSADRIEQIVGDMTLANEGIPRGVPAGVNWREKPRVGMGNDPGTFRAFITWGQVYAEEGTKAPPNTRVQIRNLQAWLLRKSTGKWERVQYSSAIGGAFYREDFADDASIPSDARDELSGGVSISVVAEHNYHFWPTEGRLPIEPEEIGGWYTAVQCRLILADETKPDDRKQARLMMSVGADYWEKLDSGWDYFKTNGDLGIGRFRFIRNDWGWHHMTTLTPEELRKNPPPEPSLN